MPGRKPIPDAIKIARGTFRPDRSRSTATVEVVPLQAKPKPRASLGKVGKAKWVEVCEWLSSVGMLDARYLDSIEMYCRAWDRLDHYESLLAKGREFVTVDSGYVCAHPATVLAKQARDDIRWYQSEFCITVSSSAKVGGKQKQKKSGVSNRRAAIG